MRPRTILGVALALMAMGCSGKAVVDAPVEEPALETGFAPLCEGRGTLDFSVQGTGHDPYEGRTIVVAAFSNDGTMPEGPDQPAADPHRVVARMSATIQGGAFSLRCERAFEPNLVYPSTAALIDVDGDGACTDADVGTQNTYFGWVENLTETIGPMQWQPVGDLPSPIGAESNPGFCAAYFN